jgi:hypothetical protein
VSLLNSVPANAAVLPGIVFIVWTIMSLQLLSPLRVERVENSFVAILRKTGYQICSVMDDNFN